jgi:hypothetical protein
LENNNFNFEDNSKEDKENLEGKENKPELNPKKSKKRKIAVSAIIVAGLSTLGISASAVVNHITYYNSDEGKSDRYYESIYQACSAWHAAYQYIETENYDEALVALQLGEEYEKTLTTTDGWFTDFKAYHDELESNLSILLDSKSDLADGSDATAEEDAESFIYSTTPVNYKEVIELCGGEEDTKELYWELYQALYDEKFNPDQVVKVDEPEVGDV